jgi:hypothetical protein
MSLQIIQTLPIDQWRAFVDENPTGNIFHTPEIFEVYTHTNGFFPELWAAVDNDQILALLTPVHISLQDGLLRRLTTRTVVYGSVLSLPNQKGERALRHLLQEYKKTSGRKSLFTEMRNISPLGQLLSSLVDEGFAYEEHLNYLINLNRPVDAIFKSIGKRTQKNIRKGTNKALVKIEQITQKSELMDCYRLLDMTYRAAHVPLADFSMFEAAFDILGSKGMIIFSIAKVGNEAAATSVELLYKDVLYGWYGGMDRKFASYMPNELLMWHILSWGAENGFKQYDFGGAGKPDEEYGVRDFKAKFGGDLVSFGRNIWVPYPALMSLSKFAYKTIRHVIF